MRHLTSNNLSSNNLTPSNIRNTITIHIQSYIKNYDIRPTVIYLGTKTMLSLKHEDFSLKYPSVTNHKLRIAKVGSMKIDKILGAYIIEVKKDNYIAVGQLPSDAGF